MELREIVKIIKNNLIFLTTTGIAGIVIAIVLTQKLPSGSKYEEIIYLVPKEEPSQSTYRFDGYYAQEKARNFTDTAVAILENSSNSQTGGTLYYKKIAPQLIRITASATTNGKAQILIAEATAASKDKIENLTNSTITIKTITTSPSISSLAQNKNIYAIAGLLLGVAFATIIISIRTYFRL